MRVRYSSSFIFTSLVPYILWMFSYVSWWVERFRTLAGWVVRLMIHSVKVEQIAPEILKDLLSDASGSSNRQWCSLQNLWTVDLLVCLNFSHCYNSWGLYSLSCVCKYIRQFWTLCITVGCECCWRFDDCELSDVLWSHRWLSTILLMTIWMGFCWHELKLMCQFPVRQNSKSFFFKSVSQRTAWVYIYCNLIPVIDNKSATRHLYLSVSSARQESVQLQY
jgi:hypothetical protein